MSKLSTTHINEINEDWLFNLIVNEFTKTAENISPLKVLSKLGVDIHDQSTQLKYKQLINKIKYLLSRLHKDDRLVLKKNNHGTLGIIEKAYQIKK